MRETRYSDTARAIVPGRGSVAYCLRSDERQRAVQPFSQYQCESLVGSSTPGIRGNHGRARPPWSPSRNTGLRVFDGSACSEERFREVKLTNSASAICCCLDAIQLCVLTTSSHQFTVRSHLNEP